MQQTIEELILKEIGGEAMEPSQKQELLDDIAESVQNYFIAFCYQKLSEDDKQQLEQLIDAGDDAAQELCPRQIFRAGRGRQFDQPGLLGNHRPDQQ